MPIILKGPRGEKFIFALLSEGSTVTLINELNIDEIGAEKSRFQVALGGVGNMDTIAEVNEKVNILIKTDSKPFLIPVALVIKNLELPSQNLSQEVVDYCRVKSGVILNSYNAVPDLLIGQDNCNLIITRELRIIIVKTLLVSRCSLGWVILGHLKVNHETGYINLVRKSTVMKNKTRDNNLEYLVKT